MTTTQSNVEFTIKHGTLDGMRLLCEEIIRERDNALDELAKLREQKERLEELMAVSRVADDPKRPVDGKVSELAWRLRNEIEEKHLVLADNVVLLRSLLRANDFIGACRFFTAEDIERLVFQANEMLRALTKTLTLLHPGSLIEKELSALSRGKGKGGHADTPTA